MRKSLSTLTLLAFMLTHLAPATALSKNTPAFVLKNPGMIGTMMAIANLNHSMRQAAENPHDEWRVQNVRHAMGLIPVALMGLASEFKGDKLVDTDLPTVLGMLGGFVDKNAADGYKKFLQNPSAENIPKLGADFPQSYIAKAQAEGVQGNRGNEAASGNSPAPGGNTAPAQATSSDLKQFKGDDLLDLGSFVAQKKMESEKAPSTATIGGNESLADSPSVPKARAVENTTPQAAPQTDTRELGFAEAKTNFSPSLLSPRDLDSEETKAEERKDIKKEAKKEEEDNFFKKVGDSKDEKLKSVKKRKKLRDGISFLPGVVKFFPVFAIINELILTEVHAEGGAGPNVGPGNNQTSPQTGKKNQCEGGSGGGAGDSQGGGAGDVLAGIAAIIAAGAPIAVAAIMSDASKQEAKIAAETSKQLANLAAKSAKDVSDTQKEIIMTQTKVAQDVADKNNQYATQRLDKQLSALKEQSDKNYGLEQEKRAVEKDYNNQRIQLATKQAEAQEKLNKESLQAEIAKAGLSQGFGNKNNIPGSQKLVVSNSTQPSGQTYSAGTRATNPGTTASQGTFSGPQLANALSGGSGASSGSGSASAAGAAAMGFASTPTRGIASVSKQSSLVASVGIPSLKGGTAFQGTTESVNALNGAVQTVNASGITLYKKILGRKGISGTSKFDIMKAKKNGMPLLASSSSALAFQAPQRGFLGTGRALAKPGSVLGITRPIRHINPYDGTEEQDEGGGELVGHSTNPFAPQSEM